MSVPSVTIRDLATDSRAEILVGFGFNCYQFITSIKDRTVDVLWAEDGFETGSRRPSGSGIPLLFPFPGRIKGGRFTWDGRAYMLEEGDGRGNAIHGFVHRQPWRVVGQSSQHVTGQFQASIDDPSLLNQWPSDFCITATYRLEDRTLRSEYILSNPGDRSLPCGFGTHPYFRIPLTSQGRAEQCRLSLPVSAEWTLEEMNATGCRAGLPDAARMQDGFELSDARFDNVFTGLVASRDRFVARIEDPGSRLTTQVDWGAPFRECVVYTPDHRESVCIEPYTCVPDPFRLQDQGADAGLLCIPPGGQISADVNIHVFAHSSCA